jgi:hypothetical protein
MGDYNVTGNSFIMGNAVPSFRQGADGIEICHSEFLRDITGSTAFSILDFELNPGLTTTFPWLSSVAQNFQEYEMLGCVLVYKPSSGLIAGTSAALGMVVAATNYNVNAPGFASKVQMEASQFATSTVPFESMIHPIECARGANVTQTLLVRGAALPTGGTLQLYDLAKFQIATVGMPSAYTVGELWISYHVRLKRPIEPLFQYASYVHFYETPNGSASTAFPFGTSGLAKTTESNPLVAVVSAVTPTAAFTMPTPGTYVITFSWTRAGANITADPTLALGANIQVIGNVFADGTQSNMHTFSVSKAFMTTLIIVAAPYVPGSPDNEVTVGGLTGMTLATCDIIVAPVAANAT